MYGNVNFKPNTIHGKNIKKKLKDLSLNLWRFDQKKKNFIRKNHINKNYNYTNGIFTHEFLLHKSKEIKRENELAQWSMDACSVKKVGAADAANITRNKRELIPNDIKLFGVDSSNQYSTPLLNIRTIAYCCFWGKLGTELDHNKLYRTGGGRLDYAITGPAIEYKASSNDIINGMETISTTNLKEQEAVKILHIPSEDDLDGLDLSFKLDFLRFALRMRLIRFLQ